MLASAILVAAAWAGLAPTVSAQASCVNYGIASGSGCACPAGFSDANSNSCELPNCGGSLYTPAGVAQGGNTSTCSCSDGWTGPACTVCTSSQACVSSLQQFSNSNNAIGMPGVNLTMTCSKTPTVYAASHMSCSVNQPTFQSLFPGTTLLTISRFLNATQSPGGTAALSKARIAGGDGEVWAQLWNLGTEQFYCHGSDCTQTVSAGAGGVNASQWVCNTLSCTCKPGSKICGGATPSASGTAATNLTDVINTLKGPLTINCASEDQCQFQQQFLNNFFGAAGLTLTGCTFGECVTQQIIDQASGITATAASNKELSGGVIAGLAVLGAIVLAIILVAIWAILRRRKARKEGGPGSLEKNGNGVGVAWSGVGYEVASHGRGGYATMVSWLRGFGTLKRTPRGQAEDGDALGPNGGRVVLRDACGDIPPGGFCCILGPSGAGKSTLVDILAGKRKTGNVQGKVAYLNDDRRRVNVGYCDQSDVLAPTSTVFETLKFAAYLRLPENIPKKVKEERARQVLHQLGLEHIADTRVGSGEHRGISGGEMRRVSIGIELVANPDVLVVDEPTSGLDSVSAARVVSLLKSLTEDPTQRTTIITSIHQPSSVLYHAFSQVILLANGRQLYCGPGGSAPAEFFAKQGLPCPAGYNIADHLLEIASTRHDGLLSGSQAMLPMARDTNGTANGTPATAVSGSDNSHFKEESDHNKLSARMSNGHQVDLAQVVEQNRTKRRWWPESHCATTFLTQLEVLSSREWRNLRRDKTLLIAHLLVAAIIAVFAGGLFINIDLTIAGFQNRVGCLFFLGVLITFSSLSALSNLAEVRPLFVRERAGSFYSPQSWLLSRILFDVVPLRIIPTIILSVIVYFMVGLARRADLFFKYLLIVLEYQIVMTLYNFLLASVFAHQGVATLLSSLWSLFQIVYAGFFVNLSQIPPVLRWLKYLAPLSYTLEALTINEVGSGLQIEDVLQGVPISISAISIMQVLFGFQLGNYYRNVLILFAFIGGFGLTLIFTVVWFLREKR